MINEEQYIRKIYRKLCCSSSRKREIVKQIRSDIVIAEEEGKTFEEIMMQMGSPMEMAKEFNDNMSLSEKKAAKKRKIIKILGAVCLLLLLLGMLIYWVFPKPSDISESKIFTEKEVTERVKEIIQRIDANDLESLQPEMTKQMQRALTEEVLQNAKANLSDDYGEFRSWGNIYMVEISQMGKNSAVAEITVSYENVSATYRLSFDEEMLLSGLYIR